MCLLRSLAPAFVLAAVATVAAPLAAQRDPAFAVAMLRRDGVIIPFAVFDGRSWSTPWPAPAYRLEAPLTMAAVRRQWWGRVDPSSTWLAWPTHGDPRTLRIRGPVVVPVHCLSTIGLQTDYRSPDPIPPPTQHHHPKDGVATTGTQTVVPIDVLTDTSVEWAPTLAMLAPAVEKAESSESRDGAGLSAAAWRSRATDAPLRLEVLCRSKASTTGGVAYYFEAARQFRPGGGPSAPLARRADASTRRDAGVELFSQGFVVLDGGRIVCQSISSTFSDAERNNINFGLPLGSTIVNGREHWIVHLAGRGREQYVIVEVGPGNLRTVVSVFGGGC